MHLTPHWIPWSPASACSPAACRVRRRGSLRPLERMRQGLRARPQGRRAFQPHERRPGHRRHQRPGRAALHGPGGRQRRAQAGHRQRPQHHQRRPDHPPRRRRRAEQAGALQLHAPGARQLVAELAGTDRPREALEHQGVHPRTERRQPAQPHVADLHHRDGRRVAGEAGARCHLLRQGAREQRDAADARHQPCRGQRGHGPDPAAPGKALERMGQRQVLCLLDPLDGVYNYLAQQRCNLDDTWEGKIYRVLAGNPAKHDLDIKPTVISHRLHFPRAAAWPR